MPHQYWGHNMKKKTMLKLIAVILATVFIWIIWFASTLDSEGQHLYSELDSKTKERFFPILSDRNHLNADNTFQNKSVEKGSKPQSASKKRKLGLPPISNLTLPKNLNSIEISMIHEYNRIPKDEDMNSVNLTKNAVGLTFYNRTFFLNHKPFRIFSGAVHYFRIVPEYWKDRLLKLKACGLNTVETYVPWNLHEPSPGDFRFDGMLNIRAFITLAADLGLYVILRPGPYICSEFDFGGLPGWLLRDHNMKVRSNYQGYVAAVKKYFSVLLPYVHDLQFSEGGPIIMYQVENEMGSYTSDVQHLKLIAYLMKSLKVKELLVTSDHKLKAKSPLGKYRDISKYALPTDNFKDVKDSSYQTITGLNPHFPYMVMELWSGWFDAWGQDKHSITTPESLEKTLNWALNVGGSFNLYMFIGGTNFGFTSGANNFSGAYKPLVTSYDYNGILSESGDITPKYHVVRNLLLAFYKTIGIEGLPAIPEEIPKAQYGIVEITEQMEWDVFISLIPIGTTDDKVNYMETYTDHNGQYNTLGYIVYSYTMGQDTHWNKMPGIQLTGEFNDRLIAILNSEIFYVHKKFETSVEDLFIAYDWDEKFQNITARMDKKAKQSTRLDLMVENLGRVNFQFEPTDNVLNSQRKGLRGPVFRYIFGLMEDWYIRFLTFDPEQCKLLSKSMTWEKVDDVERRRKEAGETGQAPTLYRAHLMINGDPADTFLRLDDWAKGIVVVNGFNLGRYWNIGPQRTLYVPAPILRSGINEIIIFEEIYRGKAIFFQNTPDLG